MITEKDYKDYFEVENVPSNFSRLEFLSLQTIKSVMAKNVPTDKCPFYDDFKKALMEQMNFYDINRDLITNETTSGYTLGSYSESASNKVSTSSSVDRLSPMTYEILLNIGLLQSPIGGCCYG